MDLILHIALLSGFGLLFWGINKRMFSGRKTVFEMYGFLNAPIKNIRTYLQELDNLYPKIRQADRKFYMEKCRCAMRNDLVFFLKLDMNGFEKIMIMMPSIEAHMKNLDAKIDFQELVLVELLEHEEIRLAIEEYSNKHFLSRNMSIVEIYTSFQKLEKSVYLRIFNKKEFTKKIYRDFLEKVGAHIFSYLVKKIDLAQSTGTNVLVFEKEDPDVVYDKRIQKLLQDARLPRSRALLLEKMAHNELSIFLQQKIRFKKLSMPLTKRLFYLLKITFIETLTSMLV